MPEHVRGHLAPDAPAADATATYKAAGGIVELQEFPGMPHDFLHPAVAKGERPERGIQVMKELIARQVARLTATS